MSARFTVSLWIVGSSVTILVLAPVVLSLLGFIRFRFVIEEEPARVELGDCGADHAERYGELLALGFRPLGVIRERVWFDQVEWFNEFIVYCLGTEDGQHFVSLYRLDTVEPLRISFETITTGRALIRTVMPGADIPHDGERLCRHEYQGLGVAELFARHLQHVDDFTKHHGTRVACVDLAARAALDEEIDFEFYKKVIGYRRYLNPLGFFLVPAFAGAWLMLAQGIDRMAAVPGALAIDGIFYLWIVQGTLKEAFRQALLHTHDPARSDPNSLRRHG
jgi:hypothetical protein